MTERQRRHRVGIVLAVWAMSLLSSCGGDGGEGDQEPPSSESLSRLRIDIHGMHCQGCADAIHTALSGHPGVMEDSVSFADSTASVRYDATRISPDGIIGLITELGYTAAVSSGSTE